MPQEEMVTTVYDNFGDRIVVTVPKQFADKIDGMLATWGERRERLYASAGSGTIDPDIAFRR